jgi:hypothetical protein
MLNQHQERAFCFSGEQLDVMDRALAERERLLGELVPLDHANMATDEWWVRVYPYEQEVAAGGTVRTDVQFTNHGTAPARAAVAPVLPTGWACDEARSVPEIQLAPMTDGQVGPFCETPDGAAVTWLQVPSHASGLYVIPFRVTWNGCYLGQYRHALIRVRGGDSH